MKAAPIDAVSWGGFVFKHDNHITCCQNRESFLPV